MSYELHKKPHKCFRHQRIECHICFKRKEMKKRIYVLWTLTVVMEAMSKKPWKPRIKVHFLLAAQPTACAKQMAAVLTRAFLAWYSYCASQPGFHTMVSLLMQTQPSCPSCPLLSLLCCLWALCPPLASWFMSGHCDWQLIFSCPSILPWVWSPDHFSSPAHALKSWLAAGSGGSFSHLGDAVRRIRRSRSSYIVIHYKAIQWALRSVWVAWDPVSNNSSSSSGQQRKAAGTETELAMQFQSSSPDQYFTLSALRLSMEVIIWLSHYSLPNL